jgi:aminotransferase
MSDPAPRWEFTRRTWKVVTPRTRGILINTPSNPTGKVFTRKELEVISRFASRHDLFVFTDEIYEHFVYDGGKHLCPATLPGMKERTITVSGLSKTFNITGWRIGYCLCDARWAQSIGYFSDLVYVCAPAPLQWGVAKGLMELKPEYYQRISELYKQKEKNLQCPAAGRSRAVYPPGCILRAGRHQPASR